MESTEKKLKDFVNDQNVSNEEALVITQTGELIEKVNRRIISEDGRQLLKD